MNSNENIETELNTAVYSDDQTEDNGLLADVLVAATKIFDPDEQREYLIAANSRLPEGEKVDKDTLDDIIADFASTLTCKLGDEVLKTKISKLAPSEDPYENLQTAKKLVKNCLVGMEKSVVEESILQLKDKLDLSYQHVNIVKQYYKEEKAKHEKQKKSTLASNCDYDMDSTSGRAIICRDIAKLFIEKQKKLNHPVKGISGKLMKYNEGIYEDSEEERSFMKKEIKDIGEGLNLAMSANLIDQTVRLIELDTLVRSDECEPDRDNVLVLNNGILDLRSWKFRDFSPDKVYFSKIPVDYIPDAPKPTKFLNFFDSCFKGNEQQKDLMQEAFGYTLTKNHKYQDMFYMLGAGGNGKGSMMGVLIMLLGEENTTGFSLKQLSDGEHVDYNVAELHGMHANICGDVGTAKVVDTETLKKLTSNTDLVTGRRVRERPFKFISYAKMFFLMNRAPETDACTIGDRRRIRSINFVNSFSEKANEIKDIHMVIKNAGELPGVLLWAIEGLKRLEKNQKFTDTRTIAQRAIEYDRKADTMRYFVEEMVEEDPGAMLPKERLIEKYSKFVQKEGGAQLGPKELKSAFLAECKEAGWNGVYCKQERVKVLGLETESVLRNDYKVTGEKVYVFHGVSLIKDEPQKTVNEFASPVIKKPHVYNSDAEAYEAMMRE